MEGSIMLMDWKTQYHKNINSPQVNLEIQCNPNQNLSRSVCVCVCVCVCMCVMILKCIWKCKGLSMAKTILKKNKVGAFRVPDIKINHKATLMKTEWY